MLEVEFCLMGIVHVMVAFKDPFHFIQHHPIATGFLLTPLLAPVVYRYVVF